MTRPRPSSVPAANGAAVDRVAAAPSAQKTAVEVLDVIPAVMDAMRHAMRQHVGEQLSVPQFRCLNFIGQQPGASISEVAGFLGVTVPTASAMVDRLVRSGAVEPQTAADDRRRSRLLLTGTGAAQLAQIRLGAHSEIAQVLARRSDDELRTLRAGLAVLRSVFAATDAP